jgi:hypothetical protein
MSIYDQLYEINTQINDDEWWISMLEKAYDEMGVNDIEELVDKAIEEQNDGIIYDLIDEGEYILSLKNQLIDDIYDFEEGDDNY